MKTQKQTTLAVGLTVGDVLMIISRIG